MESGTYYSCHTSTYVAISKGDTWTYICMGIYACLILAQLIEDFLKFKPSILIYLMYV